MPSISELMNYLAYHFRYRYLLIKSVNIHMEAYFKYLQLAGDRPAPGTIQATLRLLHLTVNHALELQEVFQLGLANRGTGRMVQQGGPIPGPSERSFPGYR